MIDYSPLWETMKKKNISQYQLLKQGIDNKTLNRLKNNKNITVLTLLKLCEILDCTPNDIIYTKNKVWSVSSIPIHKKCFFEMNFIIITFWIYL